MREAFPPDTELSARTGLRLFILAGSAQNPLESLFLLQQRPLRRGQRVLLFLGPSLLNQADYAARLANAAFLFNPLPLADRLPANTVLPASWRQPLGRVRLQWRGSQQLGLRWLHHALPHQWQHTLYGYAPPPSPQHWYEALPAGDPARLARHAAQLKQELTLNGQANLARLAELLRLISLHCRQQVRPVTAV